MITGLIIGLILGLNLGYFLCALVAVSEEDEHNHNTFSHRH